MGDAILQYKKSKFYNQKDHILLVWGDLPFLYKRTIDKMIDKYFSTNSFMTLVSGFQKNPYTIILRDINYSIKCIQETRKKNIKINNGEREIGVFLFNKKLMKILNFYKKFDITDGKKEHNFLYLISILYSRNFLITSSPISNEKEFKSLNYITDII
jgi:bifunctional N-acetylglucosamine-1-phosphate-uridyltransferase/glucosamine-1-phosphate-acetyltransferase GlmU-like protein